MLQHYLSETPCARLVPGASCSPRCAPVQRTRRVHSNATRLRDCSTVTSPRARSTLERLYLWDESSLDTNWSQSDAEAEEEDFAAPPSSSLSLGTGASGHLTSVLDIWASNSTVFHVSLQDKPPTKVEEKDADYYANVGYAIRALRDDIPALFERELDYDIYREDVTFKDPLNTFVGIKNYKIIFWSLRFHGKLFFKRLLVEVKRIWQPPSEENVIKMRWTVRGIPRVPWEAEGTFDGISTYRMDRHGKVYEHSVDNVLLRDPPFAGMRAPYGIGINLIPMEEQPVPFPGLVPWTAGCLSLSWFRLYLALCATVLLTCSLAETEQTHTTPAAEGL